MPVSQTFSKLFIYDADVTRSPSSLIFLAPKINQCHRRSVIKVEIKVLAKECFIVSEVQNYSLQRVEENVNLKITEFDVGVIASEHMYSKQS